MQDNRARNCLHARQPRAWKPAHSMSRRLSQEDKNMLTLLLIVLLLMAIGSIPSWPYSRGWGYYPSGGLGLILLILLILMLAGHL